MQQFFKKFHSDKTYLFVIKQKLKDQCYRLTFIASNDGKIYVLPNSATIHNMRCVMYDSKTGEITHNTNKGKKVDRIIFVECQDYTLYRDLSRARFIEYNHKYYYISDKDVKIVFVDKNRVEYSIEGEAFIEPIYSVIDELVFE